MTSPLRPTAGIAAVLLSAALALTACTGTTPDTTGTPTDSATDAAAAPGVTEVQDAPGSGEGLTGALVDTTTDSCAATDGGWAASGTVTNPTDAAADYRIYVSFLDGANDTRGLKQVDVDAVEAGATADWSAALDLPDEDLVCVLRVERYAAG